MADNQVVVRAGPYAAIRHPSYAGNGDPYREYTATTARLVPNVW